MIITRRPVPSKVSGFLRSVGRRFALPAALHPPTI